MSSILLLKTKYNLTSQITNYIRRGKHRPITKLNIGTTIHNYQLKTQDVYQDFNLTHKYFLDKENGVKLHQLECDQQKNTFSMIFKLNKMPVNAINYALQKMLNGGSKKYPIRNLIQAAAQKSFNSANYFSTINQDYMMYNFSTPNLKDYKNLLNVYFDMIFNPLFRKQDFDQLIWRYNIDNRNRKLNITGELAQNLKENDYYQENFIYKEIIKNFYNKKNISICEPEELVKIRYEDLVQFYRDTIRLDNLTLVNHGDMGSEFIINSLNEVVDENILGNKKSRQEKFIIQKGQNGSQNKPQSSDTQPQIKLSSSSLPKTIQFQHMKPQSILMLSFKIDNASEQQKTLLSILSYILFDMPESPFMLRFNRPETPYPILYGYKNRYFNIGITLEQQSQPQQSQSSNISNKTQELYKKFLQKQKQIFLLLQQLKTKKLQSSLIQKCLAHLQANYYTQNGLSIIQNIIDKILNQNELKSTFNVTSTIQRIFKKYRKENIFQQLIQKFLLNNKNYICFRGVNNYEVIENKEFQRQKFFSQIQKKFSQEDVNRILGYRPPNILQDFKVLPEVQPNQLEFFEDVQPSVINVAGSKVYYENRPNGIKITLKYDISDLSQQSFPFLDLFCKSLSRMGSKQMKNQVYQQILARYINSIDVRYQTQGEKTNQQTNQKLMKVYLFLSIDFNDRYFQYGFNVLNSLIKGYNADNIFALSKSIQKSASECFHQISENIVSIHGRHLAASKSPYAFFSNPVFNSRSLTGMAADLRKVTNPKQILYGISYQLKLIWQKMQQKSRLQVLLECKESKKDFYLKYLQMTLSQVKQRGLPVTGISVTNFPQQRWLKYFPNFQQQLVFQTFKFPYFQKHSAAGLILSQLVNKNISQYNKIGGSFLYKGALITFIEGGRKKVLQLQDYYRKIDQIDNAKRSLFKRFGRYTAKQSFLTGISIQQARFFKQAIIATQKIQVEQILNNYILQPLKKGQSSILCLGPRLQNYEPLLKKGWEIERSVDDLSLIAESFSMGNVTLKLQDYTKIC